MHKVAHIFMKMRKLLLDRMGTRRNKDLNDLERKFDEATDCGKHLQKMGQRLVNASEQGKEIIKDIKQDEKALDNPQILSWLAAANATIPAYPAHELKSLEPYFYAVTTSTSSATVFIPQHILCSRREFEVSEDEEGELDEYLKEFSTEFPGIPNLVSIRKGAWETFYSTTEVTLMNASHSMREILRNIISQIATNEEVKKALWGEEPPDTERDISAQERLRYLIFGPGENKPAEMVTMTIGKCFKAYSRLQQIAHGSQGLRQEVKEYMRITEYTLLTILRYRKLRPKIDLKQDFSEGEDNNGIRKI